MACIPWVRVPEYTETTSKTLVTTDGRTFPLTRAPVIYFARIFVGNLSEGATAFEYRRAGHPNTKMVVFFRGRRFATIETKTAV